MSRAADTASYRARGRHKPIHYRVIKDTSTSIPHVHSSTKQGGGRTKGGRWKQIIAPPMCVCKRASAPAIREVGGVVGRGAHPARVSIRSLDVGVGKGGAGHRVGGRRQLLVAGARLGVVHHHELAREERGVGHVQPSLPAAHHRVPAVSRGMQHDTRQWRIHAVLHAFLACSSKTCYARCFQMHDLLFVTLVSSARM